MELDIPVALSANRVARPVGSKPTVSLLWARLCPAPNMVKVAILLDGFQIANCFLGSYPLGGTSLRFGRRERVYLAGGSYDDDSFA